MARTGSKKEQQSGNGAVTGYERELWQMGDADARSKDVLGRVYEYFLSQFASAEGKTFETT